jgi:hypothetical protein
MAGRLFFEFYSESESLKLGKVAQSVPSLEGFIEGDRLTYACANWCTHK